MICRDLITALALCNNVTPIYEDKIKTFQASSPDEIALVEYACKVGLELFHRTPNQIMLKYQNSEFEFKILQIFPFTSASKKMGIILQHVSSEKIVFYMKGAEDAMKSVLASQTSIVKMYEDCETLAMEGFRTLVIVQRLMSIQEYESFNEKLEFAKSSMENREEKMKEVVASIEKEMEYLGATGVEDKLQAKVDKTFQRIMGAGIKI